MKEHKKQILAVLGLAMMLGVAMPSASFAAEGGDATTTAAAGTADEKAETFGLPESVVELYRRIQTMDGFADYRKAETLVSTTEEIKASGLLDDAEEWLKNYKYNETTAAGYGPWIQLSSATQVAVKGKPMFEVLDTLKADAFYSSAANGTFDAKIDDLTTQATTLKSTEVAQIKAVMPTVTDVDAMSLAQLVRTAQTLADYSVFAALSTASAFTAPAVVTGEGGAKSLSLSLLKATYTDEELMKDYGAMALAARAIDPISTAGLYAYELPTTSAPIEEKPSVPETGIAGLFGEGALDMGTMLLIGAVVLAMTAGIGVIAKLYLRHKF